MAIDTNYCCILIQKSNRAFQRLKALLKILEENDYSNFFSSKEKVQKKILKCLDEILQYRDSEIDGGICRIYTDCEIITNEQIILESDIIILKKDGCNYNINLYDYQNMNRFCNDMKDIIKAFENEVHHLYDGVFQDEFYKKINKIIDNYWDFIDYDYNEK